MTRHYAPARICEGCQCDLQPDEARRCGDCHDKEIWRRLAIEHGWLRVDHDPRSKAPRPATEDPRLYHARLDRIWVPADDFEGAARDIGLHEGDFAKTADADALRG